ncbi:MAG: hypothetical protein ABIN97_09120 [Ginsengibacter sp.]
MKKTTNIFKSIMAIAAVIMFISCKKEIDRPQTDLNASGKVIPVAQVVNPLTMSRTAIKTPGIVTQDDSTKTK